jgi:hypothetical protein
MSQRQERIDRIVAVEREYLAASVAAELLQERLDADPAFLAAHDLRSRDARNLRAHLEGTYVIRLGAAAEPLPDPRPPMHAVFPDGLHATTSQSAKE